MALAAALSEADGEAAAKAAAAAKQKVQARTFLRVPRFPSSALLHPFLGEGSLLKSQESGTLILTSLLEDLGSLFLWCILLGC